MASVEILVIRIEPSDYPEMGSLCVSTTLQREDGSTVTDKRYSKNSLQALRAALDWTSRQGAIDLKYVNITMKL